MPLIHADDTPFDENCLHCQLMKFVSDWVDAHDTPGADNQTIAMENAAAVRDIVRVAAMLAASHFFRRSLSPERVQELVLHIQNLFAREIAENLSSYRSRFMQ